ncbi:MAG: hypothetical protein CFE24_01790 [Flavobacterium sp. BFFFF2]|nr:MAG: hypothetical protein CFE24_01790 [Flavobacterium sp. BFFFF2]
MLKKEDRSCSTRAVFLVSSFKFQVFLRTVRPLASGQVSGFKFQVSSFRFQVSGFKFQVSGFKFQVASCKFQVSSFPSDRSAFGLGSSFKFQVC